MALTPINIPLAVSKDDSQIHPALLRANRISPQDEMNRKNAKTTAEKSRLEVSMQKLMEDVAILKADIAILKERFARTDENLRADRNRFLETYRRGGQRLVDQHCINFGNAVAHDGDAVTDAYLYSGSNPRNDPGLMSTIYGLDPDAILQLQENGWSSTIGALNEYATLETNLESAIPISNDLKKAFRAFCSVVQDELDNMKLEGAEIEDAEIEKERTEAWSMAYGKYFAVLAQHKLELRRANAEARRQSRDRHSSVSVSSASASAGCPDHPPPVRRLLLNN